MAAKKKPRKKKVAKTIAAVARYCSLEEEPEREFSATVTADRASLILSTGNKWANGTVLHL